MTAAMLTRADLAYLDQLQKDLADDCPVTVLLPHLMWPFTDSKDSIRKRLCGHNLDITDDQINSALDTTFKIMDEVTRKRVWPDHDPVPLIVRRRFPMQGETR